MNKMKVVSIYISWLNYDNGYVNAIVEREDYTKRFYKISPSSTTLDIVSYLVDYKHYRMSQALSVYPSITIWNIGR